MRTINFTRFAHSISDFDAEDTVQYYIEDLRVNPNASIRVCNLLVWNLLRAELKNSSLKFHITWLLEGKAIDMDTNMRSPGFWLHPITDLTSSTLCRIMKPTTLSKMPTGDE